VRNSVPHLGKRSSCPKRENRQLLLYRNALDHVLRVVAPFPSEARSAHRLDARHGKSRMPWELRLSGWFWTCASLYMRFLVCYLTPFDWLISGCSSYEGAALYMRFAVRAHCTIYPTISTTRSDWFRAHHRPKHFCIRVRLDDPPLHYRRRAKAEVICSNCVFLLSRTLYLGRTLTCYLKPIMLQNL
jgi:hypothetical protein